MSPLGKLATTAIALVTGTALLTGATTAYMLRPASPDSPSAIAAEASTVAPRAAAVQRRVVPAVSRTSVPAPPVTRVAATTVVPADCATGGDRAWRIAKPGALGALLGAGLGAAGGAIADGGSGAGKGAIIGGLAGVAAGAGYGAYKTQNECGTILGNGFAPSDTRPVYNAGRPASTQAAFRSGSAQDITIYDVR